MAALFLLLVGVLCQCVCVCVWCVCVCVIGKRGSHETSALNDETQSTYQSGELKPARHMKCQYFQLNDAHTHTHTHTHMRTHTPQHPPLHVHKKEHTNHAHT